MADREKLAREMFMWSESCGQIDWHNLDKAEREYWRNLAGIAMQVLRVNA